MNNVARLPLSNKVEIAKGIVTDLQNTEAAIDAALVEASRLMQTMIEARTELRLAATVGAGAMTRVVGAMSELGQARGEIVAAHNELNDLRLRMGMRTSMIGGMEKSDDPDSGR